MDSLTFAQINTQHYKAAMAHLSPYTHDNRGRIIADFLSSHGLLTINEKDGPTYSGPKGESWIYITAATIDLAHKILNWRVSEENTVSDHNLTLFGLKTRSNDMLSNRQPATIQKICRPSRKMELINKEFYNTNINGETTLITQKQRNN
jgi:hypothetical protein